MHSSRYRLTSLPTPSSRRWVRITPSRPPYPTPPAPTPTRAIPRDTSRVATRNDSSVLFTLEHLHELAAPDRPVEPSASMEKLRPPTAEAYLPAELAPPPPPLLAMVPEEEQRHTWFLPVMVGASVSLVWSIVVAIIVIYYQTHPVVVTAPAIKPAAGQPASIDAPGADIGHAAQNAPAADTARQAKQARQDTHARPERRVKLRVKSRRPRSRRSSRSRRRALLRRRRRAALRRRRARRIARARAKRRRARRAAAEPPSPSPAPVKNEPKQMTIDELLDQASR